MCRLLGVVASGPESLQAVLDSSDGFCELSQQHADGWGVAWHEEGELRIVKGALPAWTDRAGRVGLGDDEEGGASRVDRPRVRAGAGLGLG